MVSCNQCFLLRLQSCYVFFNKQLPSLSLIGGGVLENAISKLSLAASSTSHKRERVDPEARALVIKSPESALNWSPSSRQSIVVITLERYSPNTQTETRGNVDGHDQRVTCIMGIDLLKEQYPGLKFELHPMSCTGKDASRHDLGTNSGLPQLYLVLSSKGIQDHPTLVLVKSNVRFADKPKDLLTIETACHHLHSNCELLSLADMFLPLSEAHELRFERDQAKIKANTGRMNITLRMEDTRSDEEIAMQEAIDTETIKLYNNRNNLPSNIRNDITRSVEAADKMNDDIGKFLATVINTKYSDLEEAGGSKDIKTVASECISQFKDQYGNATLPESLMAATVGTYTRRSSSNFSIGFGNSLGAAEDRPVYQTLMMIAATSVLNASEDRINFDTYTMVSYHDEQKSRANDVKQGLLKLIAHAILSPNLKAILIPYLNRFGDDALKVKLNLEILKIAGTQLKVCTCIGYNTADMADKEGERRLEQKLVDSAYAEKREYLVLQLSPRRQNEHQQLRQVSTIKVRRYKDTISATKPEASALQNVYDNSVVKDMPPKKKSATSIETIELLDSSSSDDDSINKKPPARNLKKQPHSKQPRPRKQPARKMPASSSSEDDSSDDDSIEMTSIKNRRALPHRDLPPEVSNEWKPRHTKRKSIGVKSHYRSESYASSEWSESE